MRSPHTIEIPFVFNNIKIAGPLISKMPEAYALAEKVSAAWVAFARTGNPNTPKLPKWPAYSARSRDTMLFNNESRVEQDPDRGPRLVMEQVLKLRMVSGSTRVKRSIRRKLSSDPRNVARCIPALISLVLPVKLVVSTTSVLPSQWPRESPIHCRMPGGRCGRPSMGMMRVS